MRKKTSVFSKYIKQQTVAFIAANQDSVCMIGVFRTTIRDPHRAYYSPFLPQQ